MSEFHIAENLTRLRTFFDYKQKYVSEQLHISRQAYSNYEKGRRLPDLETTLRLANFYRITLEQLLLSPDPTRISHTESACQAAGISPVGSLFPMDGPETKMHINYKHLSLEGQEEARDYIEFKLQRESVRKTSGD